RAIGAICHYGGVWPHPGIGCGRRGRRAPRCGGFLGHNSAFVRFHPADRRRHVDLDVQPLPRLLLEGTFIIFSASVIVFNLLADLLYRYLDPRVRRQ
ncbi:MAG: hypothetical protein ABSF03_16870, partial [Streptosporangiaceae bacterium]